MAIELHTELGKVDVANQVIARLAGSAALECHGLVGMSSRQQLKDGLAGWFGMENAGRGVEVYDKNEEVYIDLYIIVKYGVSISEVARNVQNQVRHVLNDVVGLQVEYVNVFVQDVRL